MPPTNSTPGPIFIATATDRPWWARPGERIPACSRCNARPVYMRGLCGHCLAAEADEATSSRRGTLDADAPYTSGEGESDTRGTEPGLYEYRVRVVLEYRGEIGTQWEALDVTDTEYDSAALESPILTDEAAFRLTGHLGEQLAKGLELEGVQR